MITVRHEAINAAIELSTTVYTVVCEERGTFSKLVEEAVCCADGAQTSFVFVERGKEVKISSVANTLVDYFNLESFTKKINTALAKRYANALLSVVSDVNGVYAAGYAVMQKISDEFDVAVELRADVDIPSFIKLYNPSVTFEGGSLLSRLIDYVSIAVEFTALRVLITVNLKCYLSAEDFIAFAKHCEYKGVNLICIEASERYRIEDETLLIIDEDLCEILVSPQQI